MSTINKTYREISEFDRESRAYLVRRQTKWQADNPDKKGDPPFSKFIYALRKVLKRCQDILNSYQEQLQDINIRHASEGDDGNLALDDRGQFKFTREGLLKRNEEQRKLFEGTVKIDPYFADPPDDLNEEDKELFTGLVIQENGQKPPEKAKK